jgi:hypothetical protein
MARPRRWTCCSPTRPRGPLRRFTPGSTGLRPTVAALAARPGLLASRQDQEWRTYAREAAGSQSSADQLGKLADLRDRGLISAEEFEREKAKVLAA